MKIVITKEEGDRMEIEDYSGNLGAVGTFYVYDNGHEYIFDTSYDVIQWFANRYCASPTLCVERMMDL